MDEVIVRWRKDMRDGECWCETKSQEGWNDFETYIFYSR